MMIILIIFNSHFTLISLYQKFLYYKIPFFFYFNSNFSMLELNSYTKNVLPPHIVPQLSIN
jgi:hypothetical protein